MPDRTKIATCSYCGTRQTLRLGARDGHELACSSCGAPLHEMKRLKAPKAGDKPKKRSPKKKAPHGRPVETRRKDWQGGRDWNGREDPRRRKKRRKPLWKKALEEAFDVIEDVFD